MSRAESEPDVPDDLHRLPGGCSKGTVLITGAGRGIGRAVARTLAAAHYPLALVSKSEEYLRETHALCAADTITHSLVLDVRDEAQVSRLRRLLEECPTLHAVVNNAGVGQWNPIEQMSTASWDNQLQTNLRGPFLIIRETLGYFRRHGAGLYVNVGSDCSLVGMPERAAYNASKFGLVGLTVSLRAEAKADGIHACMVYAGKTDTYFRDHQPGDRPMALAAADVAEVIAFVIQRYPRIVIEEVSIFSPHESLTGTRSLL